MHNTKQTVKYTRYGVKWSVDGNRWLSVATDKTLDECKAHFRANTAPHKQMIRRDITETLIKV